MARPGNSLPAAVASLLLAFTAPAACEEQVSPESGPRGYIETSYLLAPRQVAEFVLEGASYDPEQKSSGAGFRYQLGEHQETRIDVYVYPAGMMDPSTALGDGMKDFREGMKQAMEAGQYTNLRLQDEGDFPLSERSHAADARSTSDSNAAEMMNAVFAADRTEGRKLSMTMNIQPQDWPMHSVGYMFYKQLYYFKVRASAAQARISSEDFHTLADRAARTLVPAIEVVNVGECADSTITLSSTASTEELARSLVTHATRHQGSNCHSSNDSAGINEKRANAEVVEISYSPQDWVDQ